MDLNIMMREAAKTGLQTRLDAAVTNGDTEAARKVSDEMAALAVSTAPKTPPFGPGDVKAELDKLDWFGVDPKKSAKAMEFGKTMALEKFPTAAAFAAAIVKAVEDDGKPAARASGTEAEETAEEKEEREAAEAEAAATKTRRTDGPSEADATQRTRTRATSGPWMKLSDAPADIRAEITRQAEKFVSSKAPKEQREKFITNALGSHYAAHQRKTGKK